MSAWLMIIHLLVTLRKNSNDRVMYCITLTLWVCDQLNWLAIDIIINSSSRSITMSVLTMAPSITHWLLMLCSSMCVCMCVCMCMCVYVCVCVCLYMCVCLYVYAYVCGRVCMHACCVCTCIRACVPTMFFCLHLNWPLKCYKQVDYKLMAIVV